ncbi:MAG: guanylate kinase [Bacteroidales bacterium]
MEGKLLIFSAPSGAGKSTIVRHLMQLDLGLEFSISATSRRPREDEKQGREYYFITGGEFRRKIDNHEFIEWEEVYPGCYYGTLRSELERIWNQGKHALFDIDVQGGLNLKREFGEKALAVFVMPPSMEILEKRLRARGTDEVGSLQERLDKAASEMKFATWFDRILVNDQLDGTLTEAESMVRNFLEQ